MNDLLVEGTGSPPQMDRLNPPVAEKPPVPTVLQLYLAFAGVVLLGFGGVLPFMRRMIVEQRRWLSAEEFNRVFSLCQIFPGPAIINIGLVLGYRFRGLAGSFVALLGTLGSPVAIVMVLGGLYLRYRDVPEVQGALHGMAAATAGLILVTIYKMARPLLNWRSWPALGFSAAAFVGVAILHVSLPLVYFAVAPFSILFERRKL